MAKLCSCKICKRGLENTVNNLAASNPLAQIRKVLRYQYSLDVSELALEEHLEKYDIEPAQAETEVAIAEKFNLNTLTLEEWGLSMNDPAAIVSFIQEKLIALSIRQMQIVGQEQLDFLTGATAYPPSKEQIQNMRILFATADKFTGIGKYADQAAAIGVVERMGYSIEGFTGSQLPDSNSSNQ